MSKQVEIVIANDGTVKVELLGYSGKECDSETLLTLLEGLLEKPETTPKDEYYQLIENNQTQGI